jgi:hypothetical protein
MRQLSANVAPLFASGEVETVLMISIKDKDDNLVLSSTSFYENITLDNGDLYEANDLLVSADPPQLSTTVDREQYKIVIADPDFMEGSEAEIGMVGKKMTVVAGFINPETGTPFTADEDVFVVYKGKVDGAAYKIALQEFGEALLQITGVSPILSLEAARGIYLSKDAVRRRNSQDSSCDQLYEGSTAVVLKWGKI